ncbi:MAG: protein-L-isoaspartate(D-aspartate) O-methyltransferase [Candidatus Woesearchaeota archaeon]
MSSKKDFVEFQLKKRGITNKYVLKAFEEVPRQNFVPKESKNLAYADLALPIGQSQTISQPYIIAKMLELLEVTPGDKVLEIGSGSGYVQALLSKIGCKTFGVEKIESLTNKSKKTLKSLKITPRILTRDGSKGLIEYHPFDKILISAAIPEIPEELLTQLSSFGIIVAPIGTRMQQTLVKLKKSQQKIIKEEHDKCMFVPLIGEKGF